jgi:hypothetical protein
MSGNKKKPAKKTVVKSSLELLATFLNFDFDTTDIRAIKDIFRSSLAFQRFPKRNRCKDIQLSLRDDVLGVIENRKLSPEDGYKFLYDLTKKINKMSLTLEWNVMPVDYEFVGDREIDLVPIKPVEATEKIRDYLAPGQQVATLMGCRWIISERASLIKAESLKEYLYWAVIQALENGTLGQLQRCKHCNNLFVQADPRKEFCGQKCKDNFHNKKRLESGYFNKLRKQKMTRALARAKRLLRSSELPETVSKETGLSIGILRRKGLIDY